MSVLWTRLCGALMKIDVRVLVVIINGYNIAVEQSVMQQASVPQKPAGCKPLAPGRPVELQVNISIGKKKYLLEVGKCSNLHSEVQRFLKQHGLNTKYEGPILAMVREELAKREGGKDTHLQYIQELKKIKDKIQMKKNMYTQQEHKEELMEREKEQLWAREGTQPIGTRHHKSNKQNFPHNESLQSHQHTTSTDCLKKEEEEHKCQAIYQKWKIKEKIKSQHKLPTNKQPSKEKTQAKLLTVGSARKDQQAKKPSLEADHFYYKGLKFQYAKEVHAEHLFKERYPFQVTPDCSVTPLRKTQLHERLYKEHKLKEAMKMERNVEERAIEKPKKTMDKYKQRVYERDSKLNETFNFYLQNKMIENPYKIETVPKSPFRKTNCY